MIRELEFKVLCQRHSDEIYRYARALLANQADAEDATQEVLLRLWNHLLALDKAVKTLRADLDAKWTPIVTVPEENVGVYALSDSSGESMAGLAVLVYDGGNAVIGNVVGHVSIGKLIKIAAQSDKLPKDVLLKLQGLGKQSSPQPAPNAAGGAKDNKPIPTPEVEIRRTVPSFWAAPSTNKPVPTPEAPPKEPAPK
jgi:hypothetical protein